MVVLAPYVHQLNGNISKSALFCVNERVNDSERRNDSRVKSDGHNRERFKREYFVAASICKRTD